MCRALQNWGERRGGKPYKEKLGGEPGRKGDNRGSVDVLSELRCSMSLEGREIEVGRSRPPTVGGDSANLRGSGFGG